MAYPGASRADLNLATDLLAWLFLHDDLVDGTVQGDEGNVKMRFDITYMEMAAKGM